MRQALPLAIKKIHRSLLPLFITLVVVCYLDRTSLAFAALQLCNESWFNARVYGLGSGVFYAGYVLFQIPSNLMLNWVGAKIWLPIITAAWGVVATCCVFISGPGSFYALRLALGVAEAGAFPALWHVCGQFYPSAYITVPYSIIEASIAVSQILAAPAAAALLQLSGVFGLAGWQWLFLAEGLATLLLAAVLAWKLPSSVLTAPFLTAQDKGWLLEQLSASNPDAVLGNDCCGPANRQDTNKHLGLHQQAGRLIPTTPAAAACRSDSGTGGSFHLGSSSSSSDRVLLLREHKQQLHLSSSCVLHEDKELSFECAGTDSSTVQDSSHHSTVSLGDSAATTDAAAAGGSGGGRALHAIGSFSKHCSTSVKLTAWQQIVSTFTNALILYLMLIKALKDIALDGLVYWVPLLIHALLDGTAVSLSPAQQHSNKHCGGKDSQLQAVLLTAIPMGAAAVAALLLGHSSEVRQERRLHIGLPLVVGGACFSLLPLLLRLSNHVPAFLAVTAAVVAADATTGPFWSWVHMAAAPGTGAVSLAAVNSVGKAGGLLGPLSFGLILQLTGSFVPSILLVAAVLLLGGVLALSYWGERRLPLQQQLGTSSGYQQLPVLRPGASEGGAREVGGSVSCSSQELARLRPHQHHQQQQQEPGASQQGGNE